MKISGSTKKLANKTENEEIVPSLEVTEVFLVQFNLIDNQSQYNSVVLYTCTPNKSYVYLLKQTI